MSHAFPAPPVTVGAPDPDTLAKVLCAAEPVLGRSHIVCQLLIQAMADPDGVQAAWGAIEALEPGPRRIIAAALGDIMMAG
ncbi:MAG: hypothetical protein O3C65_08220 [Proteobacteria bacterium]|nr:hypothetical protein [Pseudomonadota bacterium]MDA1058659.1 hypothetical protein [Pseudomonadota bacterium]